MELPIKISQQSREPIYHQIENQIKALIASGQLQTGTSLPSIRALSKDLEVSVITTRRAYQNLEYQGFIQTLQGKGTFVADLNPSIKQEIKQDSVSRALSEAIETAYQHNYSKQQIKKLFLSLLDT
ncbi:GntR family transcriptional regulator [Tenuibacillus multivorans]|uniref:GntR family transcriptional regulator n=1 Tax=Tenuibacillus multivorans TaxID=237069 RepID=A0A1G9WES8_9BACI|nr:GntR family transcriptional regulator [Tenuibacillus multivorans]GEL76422.1 GntR family transcriptional regulator [Tenuibacillus multivorans]SDM82797.1 GntR family transcriptional regulator [Tenuibacillus multivorans]